METKFIFGKINGCRLPQHIRSFPPKLFGDFPMVSALIDKDTRRWKIDLVRSMFLPFEVNTILNMPLSYKLPEDKIIYVGNRK